MLQDLETEIFLHILQQHSEAVTGIVEDQKTMSMRRTAADGDGMAFVRSLSYRPHLKNMQDVTLSIIGVTDDPHQHIVTECIIPVQLRKASGCYGLEVSTLLQNGYGSRSQRVRHRRRKSRGTGLLSQLVAPLKLGGTELLPTLVKLGSAVSVSSMRKSALQQLGRNLLAQSVRYEAALSALCQNGARGVAATIERRMAVQVHISQPCQPTDLPNVQACRCLPSAF